MTGFVRLVGLAVFVVGLCSAAKVVQTAWGLYEHPERMMTFADEIEKQSRLNSFWAQFTSLLELVKQVQMMSAKTGGVPTEDRMAAAPTASTNPVSPNFSYFAAWVISIMLLALIAKISLWAFGEGARLAMVTNDEVHVKQLIRELLVDVRSSPGSIR